MLQTPTPRQGGSQVSALHSQNRYKHSKPPASLCCWAPPTPHPQGSRATVPQNPCSPKSEPWDTVLSHKTPQGWWAAQTHPAQPGNTGLIHLILFWHEHLCGDQVQASRVPGGGPAGGGTRSRAPAEAPRQALIPQALGCSLSTDLWQPRCPLPLCSLSAPVPTLHQLCLQRPLSGPRSRHRSPIAPLGMGLMERSPPGEGRGRSGAALHSREESDGW